MPAQPRTGRNVPAEGRPDGGAVSQLSLPGVTVELVELPDTISARRRAASSCNPRLLQVHLARLRTRGGITVATPGAA